MMVSKHFVIKPFANTLLPRKWLWGKLLTTKSYVKTAKNEIICAIQFSLDFLKS